MTILLKQGQSLRREAVLALVDWSVTGRPGQAEVLVEPEAGAGEPIWRALAPGKLVVQRLAGPVAVLARPAGGAVLFEAGTTAQVRITLRGPSGTQEEVELEAIDLSAGPEQVLVGLAPTGEGQWQVSRATSAGDVDLPPGVREAYYVARRVLGDAPLEDLRPYVAIDASASMTAAVRSGLVQDVLNVVAGVCARVCGADRPLTVAAFGATVDEVAASLNPSAAPGLVDSRVAGLVPRSGAAIGPILAAAAHGDHRGVVVISDSAPADLHLLATNAAADLTVSYIALGHSRWAAAPADRLPPRQAWQDELGMLAPLVDARALRVVSVPYGEELGAARASALAEQLALGLLT